MEKNSSKEVMGTQEKTKNNHSGTSVRRHREGSPVFDYMNNSLSPIRPVKPMHITQAINPFTLASLDQSVFTYPDATPLNEPRVIHRHQLSDLSKFSSDDWNTANMNTANVDVDNKLDDDREGDLDPTSSTPHEFSDERFKEIIDELMGDNPDMEGLGSIDQSNFNNSLWSWTDVLVSDSPDLSVDPATSFYMNIQHALPNKLSCGAMAFGNNLTNPRGESKMTESNEKLGMNGGSLITNPRENMECLLTNPREESKLTNPREESKTMKSNGGSSIANPSNCGSSIANPTMKSNGGSSTANPTMKSNGGSSIPNPTMKSNGGSSTANPTMKSNGGSSIANPSNGGSSIANPTMKSNGGSSTANPTMKSNGGSSIPNPCENMDYQLHSGLYRGARKRCLVFDKAGPRVKHLVDNSTSNSCMQENDSSQCVFPARIIGLHSNAPEATPSYYSIANKDSSFYGSSLIGPGQELVCTTLTESKTVKAENGVARVKDSCQESGYKVNEEVNPSAKKKKRRWEQVWEGEGSCRRCNCKKSKCLKLYCECFAAGVYCVGPCACIDCFNKPDHKEIVLSSRMQLESKNPLAFAPKVIRGSISSSEFADYISTTPASTRHKRGCNCKKSNCQKKYCECYRGGVGCSVNCRCEGCTNEYGTKDGSCALSVGHELKEDEISASEKPEPKRLRKTTIQNGLDQTMGSALTLTPLRQVAGQSSYFQPTPNFSHLPESTGEGKMSDFVLEGSSNSRNQQLASSSSPNRNRTLPSQSSREVGRWC